MAGTILRLENLISESELCKRTGWNRTTVWRLRNRKRSPLPHYKFPNRQIRFDPVLVNRWIERHSVGARTNAKFVSA